MTISLSGITFPDDAPIVPLLRTDYTVSRATQNVFHQIIGQSQPDVTLSGLSSRTGTFTLLFPDEESAQACLSFHTVGVFTYSDDERPATNMDYVVSGNVTMSLDFDTLEFFTVAVDFTEVY